jgi:hypothetical protein
MALEVLERLNAELSEGSIQRLRCVAVPVR